MKKNKIIKYSFFALTIIIFLLAVNPFKISASKAENTGFRLDYAEHFIALLVWGMLFALWQLQNRLGIRKLLVLISIGLIYTAFIEGIQYFIPTRSLNPIDFFMNFIGFLTGFLTIIGYLRIYGKKAK